jgi:serine/threonine protein kinase
MIEAISITNFQLMNVIGRGGFGKVWIVQNKKTKTMHAMKIMSKAKYWTIIICPRIVSKKSVTSVMNELTLLSMLKHK